MTYDWQSGLVFNETIVSTNVSQHSEDCMSELRARAGRRYSSLNIGTGADSMFDMLMRLLLYNLDSLEPDALKPLPAHLLQLILRRVCSTELHSLRTWTVFARTGLFTSSYSKTLRAGCLRCNPMDLGSLIPLISSPSASWVTHLSLESVQLSTVEMMKIADITNLRSLYIRASSKRQPLNLDQIVRAWSASARERNAFRMMKMMFIDVDSSISQWTFHYLNAFPALDILALQAPYVDEKLLISEAERNGWHEKEDSQFLTYARQWERDFDSDSVDDEFPTHDMYWRDLVQSFVRSQQAQDVVAVGDIPVLRLQCGKTDKQRFTYDYVLCFERDWNRQSQPAASNDTRDKPNQERPLKKRKLKSSRQHAVDDILAGL